MRRFSWQRMIIIALTAAVYYFSAAAPASVASDDVGSTAAHQSLSYLDTSGQPVKCADVAEAKSGVLLGYIVPCLATTIESSTQRMASAMIDWLHPLLIAFIFLTVVLFGVRIVRGGGQLHTEGILLLMKITLVLWLLPAIPNTFVPAFYSIMAQSQAVVANAIGTGDEKCDINNFRDGNTPLIWAQMDCLMGKLYGFTMGKNVGADGRKQPNMLLASSIFGLLGGFFFGGTFGAILFFACIGMLWTMFWVVLRTVVTFLNGYLYASLYFIISPLFMPLILMRGTASYFEPWWKGILAAALMPVLITAYTMFAMQLYDAMLFSDNSLVQNIFNNALVKRVEGMPQPLCDVKRVGNPDQRVATAKSSDANIDANQFYNDYKPFMMNIINPLLSAANDQCGGLMKPSVDIQNLLADSNTVTDDNGKALGTPQEVFKKLFQDVVKLLILSVLIAQGLNDVSTLARLLIGSGGMAYTLEVRSDTENKLAAIRSTVRQTVMDTMKTPGDDKKTSGVSFLRNVSDLPKNIGTRLTDTLGRN